MKCAKWLLAGGALLGGVAAFRLAMRYRRDRRLAAARLTALSEVVLTARGPVEYAWQPAQPGAPVALLSHGGLGGLDQSLALSRLLPAGYAVLAVSRFGYLQSPLPADASPEAQADVFAALLDAWQVKQAVLVGASAGGPAALQFALRHPDRCRALVLISAINRPLPNAPEQQPAGRALLAADFLFWAISTFGRPVLRQQLGGHSDDWARALAQPVQRQLERDLLEMTPLSARLAGLANDVAQVNALPLNAYGLEKISAPTLVVHGDSDPLVPVADAYAAARRIPQATFINLTGAGHLGVVTHFDQIAAAVQTFLNQPAV